MITVPIIGQRDPRWGNIPLGFGTRSISNYGCTLTCLTSLAGKNNVGEVNDFFKATGNYDPNSNPGGAFSYNLVVWANVPKALKNLSLVGRYTTYDNNVVADYVYNKKIPVVVEVDAAPIGSPKSSHWVLFLGDQKCLDPWVGQIRSTGDFPIRKGFALYSYRQVPNVPLTDAQKISKVREILNKPDIGDGQKLTEVRQVIG